MHCKDKPYSKWCELNQRAAEIENFIIISLINVFLTNLFFFFYYVIFLYIILHSTYSYDIYALYVLCTFIKNLLKIIKKFWGLCLRNFDIFGESVGRSNVSSSMTDGYVKYKKKSDENKFLHKYVFFFRIKDYFLLPTSL